MRALKSWIGGKVNRFARMIVFRGLRPESAPLLSQGRGLATDAEAERAAAEWILRHGLPPEVAAFILPSQKEATPSGARLLSPASREWVAWLLRETVYPSDAESPHMPLVESICSDSVAAAFLCGENIRIMQGSIVSPDSKIGGNTYIGYRCHITRSEIGRYVSIADHVMIGPGEHLMNEISTSSIFYRDPYNILTRAPCLIQDDVWIGAACVVRRGITIGTGAVIGANSFVNCDVPPFAIMVGSPAKCIGYRFSPKTIASILETRWWELPADQASLYIEKLAEEFLR